VALVGALLLVFGLTGPTCVRINDCADRHSDGRMSMSLDQPASITLHGTESPDHQDCNAHLCHALAVLPWETEMTSDSFAPVSEWQVGYLSAFEDPDNPDRPPKL
jgi:hypothetical protein